MMRRLCCVLFLFGCGDDAGPQSPMTEAGSGTSAVDSSGGGGNETSATTESGDDSSGSTSGDAESGTDDSASTDESASDSASDDGPVELYRGPVDGGSVPGWDPDAPRPLVMLGRMGDDWIATLARVDATGGLSDNAAEEIVVWGFEAEPTVLYDGPVGGALADWDPSAPIPLVMMGHDAADESWVSTLASIAPDGTLSENVADRIIVWGWTGAEPSAPQPRYDGPIDGAVLPGWNARDPAPIVALGTPGFDLWIATLVRIAPDGTLSDNLAMSLRVWGW